MAPDIKRPEGILARCIETLAEFDFEIEHRAGRLHSNADAISRQNCKQCWGKIASDIDECERADQLVEPLSLHTIQLRSEFSYDAIAELQAEDTEIGNAYEVRSESLDPSTDEFRALPQESRRLLSMQPEIRLKVISWSESATEKFKSLSLCRFVDGSSRLLTMQQI